jgi:general transcription factor 3C polypeptide 3 (transcription factor C subunit 4)
MTQSEEPTPHPDAVDAGSTETTGGRKRGRPKIPVPDRQPRKRRKKGTGQPGGWSRGMKIGPRPAIDPGPEFNAFYTQALEAFIDEQDSDKALDLVSKAVAVNPEIYSAHALRAELLFSRGEDENALATLFLAAHASPTDPEVWFQAASAHLERYKGRREVALQQASYCFSRIIHVGSASDRHIEARFQRAAVNRELTNYSKAMRDLEAILEVMPRNSSVLRQIAEICIDTRDIARAKEIYENTLSYYRENGIEDEESFSWADILVYAQILALEEPPELAIPNALKVLKQLSRWLLGRAEEAYWDQFTDDDREFDSDDEPRRALVPEFVPGKYPAEAYGAGLPLEIRVRLGMLRLRQGPEALDEALAHIEWLEPEARDEGASVYEYPDLFLEVAEALHEAKEYDQALRYYEALKDTNAYSHTAFWLGIGASSYMCGNKLQALECYEEARQGDEKSVEACSQLSRLFADFGDKEMAMENAREAVRLAESLLPNHGKRKYETKELRHAREEAEKALKEAFQLSGDYTGGVPVERIESRLEMVGRGRHRKRMPKRLPADAKAAGEGIRDNRREDDLEYGEDLPTDNVRQMARLIGKKVAKNRQDRPPARFEAAPPKNEFKARRPTAKERDARRTDAINGLYQSLLDSTEAMRAGDELAQHTWMECADTLLKDFRGNRTFYADDRIVKVSGLAREALLETRKKWQEQQELNQAEGQEVDPDVPIPSVESSLPTEYREIPFSDWLDIFLEYALLLSHSPDPEAQHRCYTTIDAALGCIIWKRDPQTLLQIHVTYLACAMALRDEDTLYNVVLRWFLKMYEFNNDAYRLFAAVNLVYPHELDTTGKEGQMKNAMFRGRSMHQFVLKQLLQADSSLPMDYNPPGFGPVPDFMRKGVDAEEQTTRSRDDLAGTPASKSARSTDVGERTATQTPAYGIARIRESTGETPEPAQRAEQPQSGTPGFADQPEQQPRTISEQLYVQQQRSEITELNALLLLLYGQILNAAGTLTGALNYFFRAQSLDPQNPVILLSIALSYMHHTLLRTCSNRHTMLLQGWAFFQQYADARREWAQRKLQEQQKGQNDGVSERELDLEGLEELIEREIEYNRARCYHMLGLADLAIRSYEKMLSLAVPSTRAGQEGSMMHTDFAMDAAYAISTIYATSGNMEMARDVTEKYLVV